MNGIDNEEQFIIDLIDAVSEEKVINVKNKIDNEDYIVDMAKIYVTNRQDYFNEVYDSTYRHKLEYLIYNYLTKIHNEKKKDISKDITFQHILHLKLSFYSYLVSSHQ